MFSRIKRKIKRRIIKFIKTNKYTILRALNLSSTNVVYLNSYKELLKVFLWEREPILDESQVNIYDSLEDINQRRLRDAESIFTVCANVAHIMDGKGTFLEIGTANGVTTASMAINAPESRIYTINILPEEAESGAGGKLITGLFSSDVIGSYYKEKGIKNITQIYANTLTWEPDIGMIDVAFIDGCHDYDFVINDTLKVLPYIAPSGFILWHDFNPDLTLRYNWVDNICRAVEWLQANGYCPGEIYHIKDSWVGIWQKKS